MVASCSSMAAHSCWARAFPPPAIPMALAALISGLGPDSPARDPNGPGALNCDPHRYPMRTISKMECHHPSTEESAGRPDAALTSMTPTSSPTFSLCPRRVSVFHNHRFGQTLWDVSVQVVLNPLGLPVWPTFSKWNWAALMEHMVTRDVFIYIYIHIQYTPIIPNLSPCMDT